MRTSMSWVCNAAVDLTRPPAACGCLSTSMELRGSPTGLTPPLDWERRKKLLLLATLAYAFLISLLDPTVEPLRAWLLQHWCHRTGKRSRDISTPLYRLRSALSRLWLAYTAPPHFPILGNSG